MKKFSVSAPCRIDLSGGTLDLWPLYLYMGQLELVHMSIKTFATAEVAFDKNFKKKDFTFEIKSSDLRVTKTYADLNELEQSLKEPTSTNPLRWVNRIVFDTLANSKHYGDWKIHTKSEAPPGSGLGGSSVLGVALVKALYKCMGKKLPKNLWDLQTRIRDLECAELMHPAGEQDYVPALFGGLLILHLGPNEKRVEKLFANIEKKLLARLTLLYTGKPHHSGLNNWQVFRSFHEGNVNVKQSLQKIHSVSKNLAQDLRRGNLKNLSQLISEEWEARKQLSPDISPPVVENAWDFGRALGATAFKACGAGGGGSVLFVFDNEKDAIAAKKSPLPNEDWRWLNL